MLDGMRVGETLSLVHLPEVVRKTFGDDALCFMIHHTASVYHKRTVRTENVRLLK